MCFSIQIDKNLKGLATKFNATLVAEEFHYLQSLIENNPTLGFKTADHDGRVFPNYFSPIVISQGQNKLILPMRYRVRPSGSQEEIPSKFNVFNARLDSLLSRKTWKSLIGKKHGIVKLEKFYEWVPDKMSNRSRLISFSPIEGDKYFSPCLYDYWESKDKKTRFYSFAIITTEPTKQIQELGHDRSPIFLSHQKMDEWLNATNDHQAVKTLKQSEQLTFEHMFQS